MLAAAAYSAAIFVSTVPFALADTVTAAVVAGVFSVVNTVLTTLVLKQARRNEEHAIAATDQAAETGRTAMAAASSAESAANAAMALGKLVSESDYRSRGRKTRADD